MTGITIRLSSDMMHIVENNPPQKILLTNRQVPSLFKAFGNNSSYTSWTITESRPAIDEECTQAVLIPLGLTAGESAVDAGIYKKS